MKNILFVCSGNTCRSPMAAALLNALHDPQYYAESAGIQAFPGDDISFGALEALRFTGTPSDPRNPYTKHRARQIKEEDLKKASLIVGVTQRHAELLRNHFPLYKDKITVLPCDVCDPYGQDISIYLSTLTAIRHGIASLLRELAPDATGIYPVAPTDIPALCEIENDSFSTPWSKASFLLGMENPTNHTIVMKENGIVTGFAVYSVLFEDAELYDIAVAPAHRQKGIGAKLLNAVMRDVFERGAETLRLEVRQSNLSARRLYEKHGFVYDKAVRKNYYQNPTEDALLMHLTPSKIQKETS